MYETPQGEAALEELFNDAKFDLAQPHEVIDHQATRMSRPHGKQHRLILTAGQVANIMHRASSVDASRPPLRYAY